MGKFNKVHKTNRRGQSLCGRGSQVSRKDDEVTCKSCWRVMHRFWGRELPPHISLSPIVGGRKPSARKKPSCSFCHKSSQEVAYLVAEPPAYICEACIEVVRNVVYTKCVEKKLLQAKTQKEVDEAFEYLFDVVHDARKSGSTHKLELCFAWLQRPDTIREIHTDLLLSALRLTFTMKHSISPHWADLLMHIEHELTKRGEDSKTLLWGLLR